MHWLFEFPLNSKQNLPDESLRINHSQPVTAIYRIGGKSLSRGSLSRGSLSRGVAVQEGLCQGDPKKEHGTRDRDPSVDRQNTSENNTFPQLYLQAQIWVVVVSAKKMIEYEI